MSIESEILKNQYKRVDEEHILDIYLPVTDEKHSIVIILSKKPEGLFPTKEIDIVLSQRESDERWLIAFLLINKENYWLFELFCNDLIESSKNFVNDEYEGADFICDRYQTWVSFFSKQSKFLSKNSVRGLVGELLFIKHHLIPAYGANAAINSWMGPTSSKQDFFTREGWFEVKTIKPGGKTISINSLDQLSRVDYGELVVVYLSETSKESQSGFTINHLFNEILDLLENVKIRNKFRQLIFLAGYSEDQYYDDFVFEFITYDLFKVVEGFPRIQKEKIHTGISDARYDLLISHLKDYKK